MMNRRLKKLLMIISGIGCLSVGILLNGFSVRASEDPCYLTEEMREKYQQDGTLQKRIQFNEELGIGEVDPGLLKNALSRQNTKAKNSKINGNESGGILPTTGKARILLVMVDFQDMKFDPDDTEEKLWNSAFGSGNGQYPYENLAAYYQRASYGTLEISGDVVSYTAKKNRDEYTGNTQELLKEMLSEKDDEIDYSKYDGDGDGAIDCVYFHFAGPDTGWGSTWWSTCYFRSYIEESFDNMKVNKYILLMDSGSVSTMIHESGHAMGLPDYYSYQEDHSFEDGIGTWDMMSDNQGDHNGFSKWLLGWIKDEQVLWVTREEYEEKGTVILDAFSDRQTSGDDSYKIAVVAPENKGIFSEYLLIEYDTNVENQTKLMFREEPLRDGFRVFHINAKLNENQTDFEYSNYSKGQTKLIELVDPDKSKEHVVFYNGSVPGVFGESYHCKYFQGDSLTPNTNPSTTFDELQYSVSSGISIDNFTCNGNTGTFDVCVQAVKPIDPEEVELKVYDLWSSGNQSDVVWIPYSFSLKVERNVEGDNPYLIDAQGNKMDTEVWESGGGSYYVTFQDSNLEKGKYEIVLPKGMYNVGMQSESKEYRIPIQMGNLAPKVAEVSFVDNGEINICKGEKNDFYILYREMDGQLILSHMEMDKELENITIKEDTWENWGKSGVLIGVLRLQDGTFVIMKNRNEITELAHLDEKGILLDPIMELDKEYLDAESVGNTVKLIKFDDNKIASEFCSVKFPNTVKRVVPDVDFFHQKNPYLFLEQGYLVKRIDTKDSIVYFDYYNEDDELEKTYEIPFYIPGGATSEAFLEFPAASQYKNKIYLLQWEDWIRAYEDEGQKYVNVDLNLHVIDMDTGKLESTKCLKKDLRLKRGLDYNMQDDAEFHVTDKNMMLLINSGGIEDAYWFELNGELKSRRSNSMGISRGICSGDVVLFSGYVRNEVKLTCYQEVFNDAKDDPKDNLVNSKEESTNKHQAMMKEVKTGDTNSIAMIILLLAMFVSSGIVIVVIKKSK